MLRCVSDLTHFVTSWLKLFSVHSIRVKQQKVFTNVVISRSSATLRSLPVRSPSWTRKKQILNYSVCAMRWFWAFLFFFLPLSPVTGVKLMVSLQIRDGIFVLLDGPEKVRWWGSRGGIAIIVTHTKATSISMFSTSAALRVGERN